MEDIIENDHNEETKLEYAEHLNKLGFLPGPSISKCGKAKFAIKKFSYAKTSGICFRCLNNNCRLRYPVRINSFFSLHPNIILSLCSEIIKCNLCQELNITKAYTYINNEKHTTIYYINQSF